MSKELIQIFVIGTLMLLLFIIWVLVPYKCPKCGNKCKEKYDDELETSFFICPKCKSMWS